jgi:hypothetical protein
MNWKPKLLIILLVIIKVSIPLLLLPIISHMFKNTYDFGHNPDFYANIALNISEGIGYRIFPETTITMHREPGYIIILSLIFFLFGNGYVIPQLLNVVFSLITAFLIFKIGTTYKINKKTMILVIFLILFHPATLIAESRLGVEVIFSMLLVLTIYTMINAKEKNKSIYYIVSGICSALTALTRSTIIPFLIAWSIYILFSNFKKNILNEKIKNLSCYFFSFVIVFSIWPLRNFLLSQEIVLTATVSGDSLYQGMYVNKYWSLKKPYHEILTESTFEQKKIIERSGLTPKYSDFFYLYSNVKDEVSHSRIMKEVVINEYKKSPLLFLKTIARNSIAFWIRGGTNTSTTLNTILNLPIIIMSLIGFLLIIRRKIYMEPIILLIVMTYLVHLPILATARHHVPLVPFLMLLSGISLSWILQKTINN